MARERLVAVEPVERAELYHLAVERGEDWLVSAIDAARAATLSAVERAAQGVEAVAIVGKRATIPPFASVVAAHPRIHGAEGELWRRLFADAASDAGLRVVRVPGEVGPWASTIGRALGPPWSAEHKRAASAALALIA